MKSSKELVETVLKIMQDNVKQKSITGVPSGFVKLDQFTNGWQPGHLIVLAARPGMGKSAFVKSMVLKTAIDFKQSVAIFSLEHSAVNYINMMITAEADLSDHKLRRGNLLSPRKLKDLKKKLVNLSQASIFIDDTQSIALDDLETKIRRIVTESEVKLVVIDYLQLIAFQKLSIFRRKQEINIISRNLKELAKELNVPIIIISELPSSVDKQNSDKRPQLCHLREITSIDQYADIVAFVYRPEYYGIDTWDNDSDSSTKGQAELIIAKNRDGWLNSFRFKFNATRSLFSEVKTNEDNLCKKIPTAFVG